MLIIYFTQYIQILSFHHEINIKICCDITTEYFPEYFQNSMCTLYLQHTSICTNYTANTQQAQGLVATFGQISQTQNYLLTELKAVPTI